MQVLLSACGSSPTQYRRVQPGDELAQAHAICRAYAARETHYAPRASSDSGGTTTFSGQTSGGTSFSGIANTQRQRGFSSGFAAGAQLRESIDNRDAIFRGCMAELGFRAD